MLSRDCTKDYLESTHVKERGGGGKKKTKRTLERLPFENTRYSVDYFAFAVSVKKKKRRKDSKIPNEKKKKKQHQR